MFEDLFALQADVMLVMFWISVISSIVFGYFWLESCVEHLNPIKDLPKSLTAVGSIVCCFLFSAAEDHFRAASPNYESGRAILGWLWMFFSAALLVGHFLLLIGPSDEKKN